MNKFISASKLIAFCDCPKKFQKGQNKSTQKIDEGTKGNWNHKALQCVLDPLKQSSETQKHYVRSVLTPEIVSAMIMPANNYKCLYEKIYTIPYKCRDIDFNINMVIDFLRYTNDMAIITDWKTGPKFPKLNDVKNSIQAKIYAYAAFMEKEIDTVYFEIVNTHHGKVVSIKYDKLDVPILKRDIDMVLKLYISTHDNNNFEELPGPHCNYCDHIRQCKNNGVFNMVNIEPILNKTELQKQIKMYETTKVYLELLKDNIELAIKTKEIKETKDYNISNEITNNKYIVSTRKEVKPWILKNFPDCQLCVDTSKFKKILIENMNNKIWQEAVKLGVIKDNNKQIVKWVRK